MTAAVILTVIFSFIIIISTIEEKEKTKRQKMKIEAALRQEEMARGYAPGTYSNVSDDEESEAEGTADSSKMSRKELEKGMKDLEKRMETLDTLLKNKRKDN